MPCQESDLPAVLAKVSCAWIIGLAKMMLLTLTCDPGLLPFWSSPLQVVDTFYSCQRVACYLECWLHQLSMYHCSVLGSKALFEGRPCRPVRLGKRSDRQGLLPPHIFPLLQAMRMTDHALSNR